MASGIAITPDRLREISVRMKNGAADVRAILSRLAGAVEPVGSEWVGAAQIQFKAHWDQLQRDANDLQSVLIGIATLVENAAARYAGTERGIAGTFDAFRAELDRLSDLLEPGRHGLPAPALGVDAGGADAATETDADPIDGELARDDPIDETRRPAGRWPDTTRVPWARFMTPAAWREIEAAGS